MTWWQYLLLVNLYLVLFYGFYTLLLRSETFFQLNRVYLVISALLSFFIPLIHSNWIRDLFITQKVQYSLAAYSGPMVVYHFKPIEDHHITIGQLLLFIYITGAAILTIKFIWQLISLKRIINRPGVSGSFSFFKSIRVENSESRDVIAAHEQVHAREWHSADVLLIEAISIINWFNPVVYFYRLGIKHIHEFIADRQALRNGTSKSEYALLLLSQTLKAPAHQLVNPFFNHSLLKRRIIMLQKNHSKRAALLKYGLSAPLFILMLILSSATISKSRTVKLLNNKAAEVFMIATSKLDSAMKDSNQAQAPGLTVVKAGKPVSQNELKLTPVAQPDTTPVKKDTRIFTTVEKEPEFKGGMEAFYKFLQQNIHYPAAMRKNNIQGKVFITFIVEKDGSLSDVHTVRDIGSGTGDEAVRVIKLSPNWNPGIQNGRPVRVAFTMPISFTLDNAKPVKDATQRNGEIGIKMGKNGVKDQIIYNIYTDTSNRLNRISNNGLQPLYIVDGKEVTDLTNVPPSTIESIHILKPKHDDDSMVELYGVKALNGVVLVKTKKATVDH